MPDDRKRRKSRSGMSRALLAPHRPGGDGIKTAPCRVRAAAGETLRLHFAVAESRTTRTAGRRTRCIPRRKAHTCIP
jgi:hypothetical protein